MATNKLVAVVAGFLAMLFFMELVTATLVVSPARPTQELLKTYYYNTHSKQVITLDDGASISAANRTAGGNLTAAVYIYAKSGMYQVGWDIVYVEIDPLFLLQDPDAAYYCAGFAEGAETSDAIFDNFNNLYPPDNNLDKQASGTVQTFIHDQWTWVQEQANNPANQGNPFWTSARRMLKQMDGLVAGYQSIHSDDDDDKLLLAFEIYMLSFSFELGDVKFWETYGSASSHYRGAATQDVIGLESAHFDGVSRFRSVYSESASDPLGSSHCSALVKVTQNDLIMGHATWSGYHTMLRQYKTYAFERVIAFSGYPGIIHSGDDWYMLSNGLTVQETTINNYNTSSAKLITSTSVPEFIRVMVANRVAASGSEWTSLFCQYNSGTYNNQYMVVDMNLFNPNGTTNTSRVPDDTLWIVEQMPGLCKAEDVSGVLRDTSYWASYNRPAIPIVAKVSGINAKEAEYGWFFSYDHYSRATIFERNQTLVVDVDSAFALLRYNDYLHDPLSVIPNCTMNTCGTSGTSACPPIHVAGQAIAARIDLQPAKPTYQNASSCPLGSIFRRYPNGAIDAKVTSASLMVRLEGVMVSGPTVQPASNIGPWDWDSSDYSSITHRGMPSLFNFEIQNSTALVEGELVPATPSTGQWWILGLVIGLIVLAVVAAIIYKRWQLSKEEEEGSSDYVPVS
jgi:hypothetical protein